MTSISDSVNFECSQCGYSGKILGESFPEGTATFRRLRVKCPRCKGVSIIDLKKIKDQSSTPVPPSPDVPSLQRMINDHARNGALSLPPGEYYGQVVIDRPLIIEGYGEKTWIGSFVSPAIRITAEGVVLRDLMVEATGQADDIAIEAVPGVAPILENVIVRGITVGCQGSGSNQDKGIEQSKIKITFAPPSSVGPAPALDEPERIYPVESSAPVLSSTPRVSHKIDALFEEAEQAEKNGDWMTVIASYEDILLLAPDNDDAEKLLVRARRKAGTTGSQNSFGQTRGLPPELVTTSTSMPSAAQPKPGVQSPWGIYRADLGRTGSYETRGIYHTPKFKWRCSTAETAPAIEDGLAYFGTGVGLGGHGPGGLQGVDISTGDEKWRFTAGVYVGTPPAIADGAVYFGDSEGCCYAIDIKTQHKKWGFRTGGYVRSSPLVFNGLVIFGSSDGFFRALDVENGRLLWQFQGGGEFLAPASLSGEVTCFGSEDGHVYAVNTYTGKEIWRFKTQGGWVRSSHMSQPIIIADEVVYFQGGHHGFYALDLKTGQPVWTIDGSSSSIPPMAALCEGVVYFASNIEGNRTRLHAMDARTGGLKWEFYPNYTEDEHVMLSGDISISTERSVDQTVIYVSGSDLHHWAEHYLLAISASSGKEIWRLELSLGELSSPVIAEGVLYSNHGGNLYAFE